MLLRARRFADRPMAVVLMLVLAAALAAGAAARAGAANRAGGADGPRTSKPKVTAPTAVPQGFVGVNVDGPMLGPDTTVDFGNQLKTMVTNGVQSIRVAFNWAAAQPYKTDADVPADRTSQFTDVGGVPTSFQITDMIVGDAARERLTVLRAGMGRG